MANEQVHTALALATAAYPDHDRKYTAEPCLVHPLAVRQLVRDAGGTDAMQAALGSTGQRYTVLATITVGTAAMGWRRVVMTPEDKAKVWLRWHEGHSMSEIVQRLGIDRISSPAPRQRRGSSDRRRRGRRARRRTVHARSHRDRPTPERCGSRKVT